MCIIRFIYLRKPTIRASTNHKLISLNYHNRQIGNYQRNDQEIYIYVYKRMCTATFDTGLFESHFLCGFFHLFFLTTIICPDFWSRLILSQYNSAITHSATFYIQLSSMEFFYFTTNRRRMEWCKYTEIGKRRLSTSGITSKYLWRLHEAMRILVIFKK